MTTSILTIKAEHHHHDDADIPNFTPPLYERHREPRAMAHPISKDHGRLVKCLYRQLLRDARRVRHSRAPFLFLQERPSKDKYSHLWEVTPDHDAKLLDAFLPSYLRHELTTCELKAQVRALGACKGWRLCWYYPECVWVSVDENNDVVCSGEGGVRAGQAQSCRLNTLEVL